VRDTSGTIAKEKMISSSTGSFFDHRKDDDKNRFSMKRAQVITVLEENAFIIKLKILIRRHFIFLAARWPKMHSKCSQAEKTSESEQ
jgi:hypothetical protein